MQSNRAFDGESKRFEFTTSRRQGTVDEIDQARGSGEPGGGGEAVPCFIGHGRRTAAGQPGRLTDDYGPPWFR